MPAPFHVTFVHPCVGRRAGDRTYIRTWSMEPLPVATLAALLPAAVGRRFFDDRIEVIDIDAPTDLVAISVETYTARRAYQIASDYRRRGVPVVMGGFHATLRPDEVGRFADSVVVGEAEALFPQVVDDWRHGCGQRLYKAAKRPTALRVVPDRSILRGKPYLPITLVETARGCRFRCDFCAITAAFAASQIRRDPGEVVAELRRLRRPGRMVFFIDDNIVSDLDGAKALFRALAGQGIRWVGQASMTVAADDEALALMRASGCQGILIGIESLDEGQLRGMNKGFNLLNGGPLAAIRRLHQHSIRVYGTFLAGYDGDSPATIERAVAFAEEQGLFIAAFNHLTPFPGTPLYDRLERAGRLRFPAWWLDPHYRYGMVPFTPVGFSPEELEQRCIAARRRFYRWGSILSRARHRIHWRDPWMLANFLAINAMHQRDVDGRNHLPLGDAGWQGELLEVG
ncbi:B12-binding domain-containing radical SAM protein [Planctomycetota bacterium]|nr:B12-binding domain-containing radical SAM protein [Planctomycetota bacterium]